MKKRRQLLDHLTEEEKENLCECATQMRIIDLVVELKKRNIQASAATVSRFLRQEREKRLLADGEDMSRTVETLANRDRKETLRQGAMEAVRQRLYEQAVDSGGDPAVKAKLFETLLKEETRLKELELEERRTAVAEENVKVQRQRVQVEVFKAAFQHIPEALRILCDDRLADSAKVMEARRCLSHWNERVGPIPLENARAEMGGEKGW